MAASVHDLQAVHLENHDLEGRNQGRNDEYRETSLK